MRFITAISVFALCSLLGLTAFAQLKFTIVKNDTALYDRALGKIDFSQHVFMGYMNMAYSKIEQADFSLSEFQGLADFGSTRFQGNAAFDNATFDTLANFLRARFESRANFAGTVFQDELIIEGTTFMDDALFISNQFKGRCDFLVTKFLGYAHFSNSIFAGRTAFSDAVFAHGASFKGISLEGDLIFSNAIFLGDLDFSNVTNIKNRIDLTVVKTDSTVRKEKIKRGINLTNSDISKFKIDYSLFYLKFDSSATFEYRSNAYQSLLNTFKNDGYTESYELLDKEYRKFVYDKKSAWFGYIIDKYWWDFGYAKHYIFYWTVGFLLFFTVINLSLYPFLQKEVYKINHIENSFNGSKGQIILLRLYYSLVYTSVLFFSLSVKLDNLKYKHWYAVAYVFVIYVLGVICLAYTANFVITK